MLIPCYPDFAPLTFVLKPELDPLFSQIPDGISEYTFSNLYLFRERYNYHLALVPDNPTALLISGERDAKRFFMTPSAVPSREVLIDLFKTHDYWKGISDSVMTKQAQLTQWGIEIVEDRDNFDYLYLRTDLADLPGKRYHKKRNLVNGFINSYSYHKELPLTPELIPHALSVLEHWREDKGAAGDYLAALEALERFPSLNMQGALYYINGRPAGWCLGESLAQERMFVVHFEKAIDEYKGIYQFINQTFAASLPERFTYINREQDLGDEGLRQAKMTYRPVGFVRKYIGHYKA
jgi:hypothetical protein